MYIHFLRTMKEIRAYDFLSAVVSSHICPPDNPERASTGRGIISGDSHVVADTPRTISDLEDEVSLTTRLVWQVKALDRMEPDLQKVTSDQVVPAHERIVVGLPFPDM